MRRFLAESKRDCLQGHVWVNSFESDYMAYISPLSWLHANFAFFLKFIFAVFPVFV